MEPELPIVRIAQGGLVSLGRFVMYVLVAISIVAFLALVWATVAIVIHVREAGRARIAAAGDKTGSETAIRTKIAE